MSEVVAVIPVRYGAQRFPGKALAPIHNKPMVQWVVEGVSQARKISQIIVATDDSRIADCVQSLNVEVVMTDPDLPSGSDRVYQAIKNRHENLILNIQGDEPLISGKLIDQMAESMMAEDQWEMITLGRTINKEELLSPNTAKIVLNERGHAQYFSRFAIPYSRNEINDANAGACLKHIGIYGYKKEFLKKFCQTAVSPAEKMEGLEQLRALYIGGRIKVLKVDYESWGVDVPADIEVVEKLLKEKHD